MKKEEWMKNERLLSLIDQHNNQHKFQIKTVFGFARLLYDECFEELKENENEPKFVFDSRFTCNSPENNEYRHVVDAISKRIKADLRNADFKKMNGTYMLAYCKFFHCSADYLLGLIEMPTHAETDIHAETGLSADAIKQLIKWNEKTKLPNCNSYRNSILFISDLLECCGIQAVDLANNVSNYLLYRKISETENLTYKITKGIYDKYETAKAHTSRSFMNCLEYIYAHSKNILTKEELQKIYPRTEEEKLLDEILG